MAAAKKSTKSGKSTDMVKWDEELAKYAEASMKMEESAGGGQFFSLKAGVLSLNDTPMPNNEMAVIILDSVIEKTYYEGAYDPDDAAPPTCFAFGRDDDMGPHERVVEAGQAQSDVCRTCPMNAWGSADRGKGKACRDRRRIAMIPAGHFTKQGDFEMIEDLQHYKSADLAFMKLPPTSLNSYGMFVKKVGATLRRPPFGVVTRVSVVPDSKSQFKVLFEVLEEVDAEMFSTLIERVEEAKSVIETPYSLEREEREEKPKRGGRGKPAAKPAARDQRAPARTNAKPAAKGPQRGRY